MSKVIVQILRAPVGGIRKHVFDIIDFLNIEKNVQQIFITNIEDTDTFLPNHPNLKIYHLPIADQPQLRDLFNIFSAYKFLRKYRIDVIHGHGAKGGIYARVLALFLRARCVYTPHGGSLHRNFGKLKNKLYDLVEFILFPFTDVYLFESIYSHNEFANNVCNPRDKSIVNYNGVEIPNLKSTKIYFPKEKIRLASFGLLRKLKGHDIAIKSCSMLAQKNIPFSYVIYGRGEEREMLNQLIQDLNLDKFVSITDFSGDVLNEMCKYDFIIHPSRFESFGYVPVEAMSVGVPVIVSSEGGLKEVVTSKTGFISNDNTPESYFEILENLYEGNFDVQEKVDLALERVEKEFSKISMLKKIRDIYSVR